MIFRAKKYQKCRLIILTLWLENSKKRKTIYSNVIFGVKIQIYRKITLKRFWIFAPKNNKKVGWKIWPFLAWKFKFMQNYPRKQKLFWQFLAWKFKRNIFFHFPSFSGNFSLFFFQRGESRRKMVINGRTNQEQIAGLIFGIITRRTPLKIWDCLHSKSWNDLFYIHS